MSGVGRGLRKGLSNYGDTDFSLFLRRAFIKAMGLSDDALERPIIAITNTFSDYNPCHGNVPALIEAVKRGVMLAGGLPLTFPTISIHESFAHPSSMFLRNLMAMDTEEMIRAQPMDAVVLIGGCDKTVPAQIMAAASVDLPAIVLPVGPASTGNHRGQVLGACTDCRRLWGRYRAGEIDQAEIDEVNGRLVGSVGTCTVMGTASTMACLAEALGLALPNAGSAPATAAERMRLAEATGKQAAALAVMGRPRPGEILTDAAFRNAMVVLQALGGSTNGIIHLAAIAGRVGRRVDLAEFDRIGREVPVLVDLKPSGDDYMEDFHAAGGMPRLLAELTPFLDLTALSVTGTLAGSVMAEKDRFPQSVIRSLAAPLKPTGAMAILTGNLCPRGAVIKHAAASDHLSRHTGRAVVFDSIPDLMARIDTPDLDVAADDVLVLRNAGPKGAPGMPEAGYLPIPRKLAAAGVKDMVRISDARMSGTAFGTIVVHVTPESAVGGPLARVRNGDRIRLDIPARRLDVLLDDAELAGRIPNTLAANGSLPKRGYARLFQESVLQADEGCDFAPLPDAVTGGLSGAG
jgi:dihydroxy-acid dehydratase